MMLDKLDFNTIPMELDDWLLYIESEIIVIGNSNRVKLSIKHKNISKVRNRIMKKLYENKERYMPYSSKIRIPPDTRKCKPL